MRNNRRVVEENDINFLNLPVVIYSHFLSIKGAKLMSGKTWIFELDNSQHTVEYVKGGALRELLIKVDGLPLQEMQRLNDRNQLRLIFSIGKHRCLLQCKFEDWAWDLYVDGCLIY